MMSILVNVKYFDVHVKMVFVLTLTVHSNIWTLFDCLGILCMHVIKNMEQLTYSKCKVASLLWFAHFDMRVSGGAQVLTCSHVVDHTSILLIF